MQRDDRDRRMVQSGAAAGRTAGHALAGRSFWIAFLLFWVGLTLLLASGIRREYGGLAAALAAAFVNIAPLLVTSVPLAAWRRHLLSPDWPLWKLSTLHVALALVFAFTSAVLALALERTLPLDLPGSPTSTRAILTFRVAQGITLYILLAGYLMWTESQVRVAESRTVAAREAELRARAEVRALHARFNPHFVFNTLHSLLLLVRAEPDAAERAIEDVAALIRYASVLQRREIDQVALDVELAIARRYLALEALRLDERIRVEWQIAGDVGDVAVPSFALQTLIENAVRHGIAPKPEGGTIRISAKRNGDALDVMVVDDGAGADPAAVAAAAGGGIDVLRRRLHLQHDEEDAITYETAPGSGFRIRLRIPAHPAAKGEAHESILRVLRQPHEVAYDA